MFFNPTVCHIRMYIILCIYIMYNITETAVQIIQHSWHVCTDCIHFTWHLPTARKHRLEAWTLHPPGTPRVSIISHMLTKMFADLECVFLHTGQSKKMLNNSLVNLDFSPMNRDWRSSNSNLVTRWAPTSYKWSYNPYKWPYKWVTGVITPISGLTGRGPPCSE